MSEATQERLDRIKFSAGNERKDVHREVELRTRAKMDADPTSKLTYQQAVHAVFRADLELHRMYLDTDPPLRAQRN